VVGLVLLALFIAQQVHGLTVLHGDVRPLGDAANVKRCVVLCVMDLPSLDALHYLVVVQVADEDAVRGAVRALGALAV
jgi:hypothetical protein